MIQGTGSDVGKSLLVAGLARAFVNRGLRVAPFKPQNMSNNAAVTLDGGEIGRAQALQARAARIISTIDLNPILLKPQGKNGAQIIVRGKIYGQAEAKEYQGWKAKLLPVVMESFNRLKSQYDLIIVEGAGSAAEINLRVNDIANMGFAQQAQCPVILVGDIDRGGVIAQLVGCKAVLDEWDLALIKGFIVNKFRGDASLFQDGMEFIASKTGWKSFGLLPFFDAASNLPAEDAFSLRKSQPSSQDGLVIAVPMLPHIANFDDFDPLKIEPGVTLVFVHPGEPLPNTAKLIILPGSKATISDLAALRANGWDIDLYAHARRGGRIYGVCGGYQMLGRVISDPNGVEGSPSTVDGLGLLEIETVLTDNKILLQCCGQWISTGTLVTGYEMHVGATTGADCLRPVISYEQGRVDGASASSGRISGAYLHGIFSNDVFRRLFLQELGHQDLGLNFEDMIEQTLDNLAAHCEAYIDVDALWNIAR
jgi:adenosylcobyric acid synthase